MDNPKKHVAAAASDATGAKPKRPKHFHAGPNPVFQPCTQQSLVLITSSRLARHIIEIKGKLTVNEINALALSMPQLATLRCELIPSDAQQMALAPKLEVLELGVGKLDAATINAALKSMGQLKALEELMLEFSSWLPELSFAPLSQCAALEILTLKQPEDDAWETQPTDAHLDQLRALPHLRSVSIHYLDGSSLPQLLRAPHTLQWEELSGFTHVRVESAAALRNLPGLLTLETWHCHSVAFLPALTRLQSLTISINRKPWAVSADDTVEAISHCRQLTFLKLAAPVTCKHLTLLLPQLTSLHTLMLSSCSELESLSFLSDVPSLQPSLRLFELKQCCHPDLRSTELRHVLSLKALTTLKLLKSFSEPLDSFTRQFFEPPSTGLSTLTAFGYEAPVADDDGDDDDDDN